MFDNEHKSLLRDLKNTVEYLLVSQIVDIWSIFGSLNRLHADVENIFKNGLKEEGDNISFWNFVKGLNWLQANNPMGTVVLDIKFKPHYPGHIFDHADSIWLYHSLENHSLSQQLFWLTSDVDHLNACYEENAFLKQRVYVEALIICLKAVERQQQCLLSDINPSLFLSENVNLNVKRMHRRTLSFPITQQTNKTGSNSKSSNTKLSKPLVSERRLHTFKLNKLWRSLPDFRDINTKEQYLVQVMNNKAKNLNKYSKNKSDLKKTGTKARSSKRENFNTIIINNQDIIEHKHKGNLAFTEKEQLEHSVKSCSDIKSPTRFFGLSKSPDYGFLDSLSGVSGEKDYKKYPRKTFIEDGGSSVQPMFTGYFPKPFKGQSLTSFLISSQFTRANAGLDRENAHFCISEAIIAAMEQIRCRNDLKCIEDESDEEIESLKQRIRMRRRQKFEEQQKNVLQMPMSKEICKSSASSENSSDGVDDIEIDEACNLPDNRNLSMSMASLYSESDLVRRPRGAPDGASDILSAESVALSLISKFKETQLPKASELEWMISEDEVAQELLPLPLSVPISPDEADEIPITPLRGTKEWAPPRPQIIFTLHPFYPRNEILSKQNYRCAGCGMRVASQYAFKYRYCNYLGRYFCTGCHTNQLSLIPAYMLQKWDFSRYKVSTFSYRLLEQMYTDPLFRVFDLNKNITKQSKNLRLCKMLRHGLFYLKDYILTCRFASGLQEKLSSALRTYSQISIDPDVYSMEDLVSVRNGDMGQCLKSIVDLCSFHIAGCELCLARGFICEICQSNEVIYPWQLNSVSRCSKCGVCFHSKCWNSTNVCLRCIRYNKRRQDLT